MACSKFSAATTPSMIGTSKSSEICVSARVSLRVDQAGMSGRALNHGAQRDQRGELSALRKLFDGDGHFVRARHPHDRHVFLVRAVPNQAVDGSLKQLLRQEIVEAADDDSDLQPLRIQSTRIFFPAHVVLLFRLYNQCPNFVFLVSRYRSLCAVEGNTNGTRSTISRP